MAHVLPANLDPEIGTRFATVETFAEIPQLASSLFRGSFVIQKEVPSDLAVVGGQLGIAGVPSHRNAVKGGPTGFYTDILKIS